MKILKYIACASLAMTSSAYANQVQDHYKSIISQTPYNVEVCRDHVTSGDKTGDALTGAIIGGILGNNIKGEKDGGTIGAIIGGMLGHSNSSATGNAKRICRNQKQCNPVSISFFTTCSGGNNKRCGSHTFQHKAFFSVQSVSRVGGLSF